MKTVIFLVLVLICFNESLAHLCNDYVLQKDVDYTRLVGEWRQAYHTRDSRYSDFECFDFRIFGASKFHKLFYAEEIIHQIWPKMGKIEQRVFCTMCWENCLSEREIHIKGHIATDYDNYMIIHSCVEGQAVIDIEVRKDVKKLSPTKIREISELLEKIGVDFFSLQERDRSTCPPPRR